LIQKWNDEDDGDDDDYDDDYDNDDLNELDNYLNCYQFFCITLAQLYALY